MREREAKETGRKEVLAKCQVFCLSERPSVVPGALLIGLSYSPDHPLTWMDFKLEVRGSLGVTENIAGEGRRIEICY